MGRLTSRPTARGFRSPLRPTARSSRSSSFPTPPGFRSSYFLTALGFRSCLFSVAFCSRLPSRLTLARAVVRSASARAAFRLSAVPVLVCAVSASAAAARAQDLDDVTVAGRVSDQTGAAVLGARVAVTLGATGARREALTDEEGRYRLVELAPGESIIDPLISN